MKKFFPKAQIHFLTRSASAPILKHDPHVDRVLVHPEKNGSFTELARFVRSLRSEHYDWVLDLAAEPRSAWLTFATGGKLRAGYAFRFRQWAFNRRIPKNKVRKYQGEVNLDILRALGVPDDGNQTGIFLKDPELQWAEKAWGEVEKSGKMRFRIGLNPTGMWSSKRWPADHWRRLGSLIRAKWGVQPVLFGAPADREILEEIRWGTGETFLVKPDGSLLESAAFLSKMDILIGNDGTPQHMAQAFGVKSLTLCGPHWGMSWTKPGDRRHRYLQHFLDCGPCDLNVCPYPRQEGLAAHVHQECLLKITPMKVFETAGEMLL